jgi:predicted RNase H-like HicB family nuclease
MRPWCRVGLFLMITAYIDQALRRARYERLDDGLFCGTVRGLRGVVATGDSLEQCRDELAEVVEEWVLVRIARRLDVPALGGIRVQVKKAS